MDKRGEKQGWNMKDGGDGRIPVVKAAVKTILMKPYNLGLIL